jgi:hypothetical protein
MMFARAFNSAKVSWAIFGGEGVFMKDQMEKSQRISDVPIVTFRCFGTITEGQGSRVLNHGWWRILVSEVWGVN